ncbi:putative ferric-chelate reductase 1 [Oryzias melastigma]|uniref:Putative ferric-chelate reductase 1 n=1 Tax=Oryzias melastigma TaxID=30732 RepID=A0A834BPM5_ORYME|nr:putative ferric-chelate reductase 1 [Oryzias melastigma]
MEKYRPLLCILFVTLSLGCIRTSAQNTTEGLSTTPAATVLPVSNGIVTTSAKNLALNATHGSMAAGTNLSVAAGSTQNVGAAITQSMAPGTNQSVTMSATKSVAVGTTQNVTPGATQSMTISATKSVAADTSHTVTMAATQSLATGPTQTMAPGTNHTVTMAATQSLATGPTQTMAPGTNHTITMAATQSLATGPTQTMAPGTNHTVTMTAIQSLGTGPTQTMAPGTNHTVKMTAIQSLGTGPTQTMAPGTNHTVTMAATQSLGTGPTQTMAPGTNHTVTMAATQSLAPAPTQSAVLSSVQTVAAAVTQHILAGNNSTSQPSTTTVLPVSPNITVETLPLSVNSVKGKVNGRTIQCTFLATVPDPLVSGTSRTRRATGITLSVSTGSYNATEPSSCNPAAGGTCSFLSAKQKNGQIFFFELSGLSDGYIGSVFSPTAAQGNNDSAYVCANSNGAVKFITAVLNENAFTETLKEVTYVCAKSINGVKFFGTIKENETLTLAPLHVNSVKGKVNGTTIQCIFQATVPDPLDLVNRARRATGVTISLSTGSFNTTSEILGKPTEVIRAEVVDLAQPNTTVVNTITTTPTPVTTPITTLTSTPASTTTSFAPTVALLETVVSNTSCGTEKLCAARPTSCNPAAGGTCSFLSVKQKSGQIYSFEISGQSTGYIGSLLSIDTTWGNNDSAYLCANNNGRVTFITALYDGTQLTVSSLNVTSGSEAGRVDGSTIQCTFESTLPDTNTRAADYAVAVINGTYDIRTGALGIPSILFNTSILNLTDVANSSPGVVPNQQSLLHVLLLSAGVLSLTILTGH